MTILSQMEDAEKVWKMTIFRLFQIRPKVCENQVRCGIARDLIWNRTPEFAGKIKIFPQTQLGKQTFTKYCKDPFLHVLLENGDK